jgi:hypothetical protein
MQLMPPVLCAGRQAICIGPAAAAAAAAPKLRTSRTGFWQKSDKLGKVHSPFHDNCLQQLNT